MQNGQNKSRNTTRDRPRHMLTAQSGGHRIPPALSRKTLTTRKETMSDIWRWPKLRRKLEIESRRRTTISTPITIFAKWPLALELLTSTRKSPR